MKNMKTVKTITITLALLTVITSIMMTLQSCQETKDTYELVKVGIYDTRIIALVYYRSEEHSNYISQLKKEREEAMEAGDDELVELINKKGPGMQDLAHKQGFSTLPIPNLLEKIKDSIPVIAERFELDVIMNKWEIIYQKDKVEFIDISMEMISFFNPSEETMKLVDQMSEVDPVPLSEIFREDVETWCPEY